VKRAPSRKAEKLIPAQEFDLCGFFVGILKKSSAKSRQFQFEKERDRSAISFYQKLFYKI
jgi:hypothetical protein